MDYTYEQQLEILQKSYLTSADIRKLVPIGEKESYRVINEILEDMESNNIPIFKCRPKLVPTKYVIEKLKIDVRHIKRMAKQREEVMLNVKD